MSNQAIAARYAKALFEVSLKEADLHAVEQQLAAFAGLMTVHRDLEQVLTNPAVPVTKKQAVVKALVERQKAVPVVARILRHVRRATRRLGRASRPGSRSVGVAIVAIHRAIASTHCPPAMRQPPSAQETRRRRGLAGPRVAGAPGVAT